MFLFDLCANCGCGPSLLCGCLPASNLTLTTHSNLGGVQTRTLVFNGSNEWADTSCVGLTVFRLTCNLALGTIAFASTRYPGGPCLTGTPVSCTSSGSSPAKLTLVSQSCDPLYLEYSPAACSSLSTQGYTKLVVTL